MENSRGFTMALKKKVDVNYKQEVCELFELATKHNLQPKYLELQRDGPIHNATFSFRLTVGKFTAEAHGPTKIIAKTLAAQQILPELRRLPLPEKLQKENANKKKKAHRALPAFRPTANPISFLHEIVTNWRGKPAEYTIINVDKSFSLWVFYVRLTVADQTVVGAGNSPKEAKRNAAAKALNTFGYSFQYSEPENTNQELLLATEGNQAPVSQDALSEVTHKNTPQPEEVQPPAVEPKVDTPQPEEVQPPAVEPKVDTPQPEEVQPPAVEPKVGTPQTEEVQPPALESQDNTPQSEEVKNVELIAKLKLQQLFADIQPLLDFMEVETPIIEGSEDVCIVDHTALEEGKIDSSPLMPEPTDGSSREKAPAVNKTILTVVISMVSVEPAAPAGEDSNTTPGGSDLFTSSSECVEATISTSALQPAESGEEDTTPGGSDLFTSSSECVEATISTNAHQPTECAGEDIIPICEGSDPSTSSSGLLASNVLSHTLVKKVCKMAGSHSRLDNLLMAINLKEKIKDQLIVSGECDISVKDLEKIGKTAAKQLVLEHGSARALLKAASEDAAAFEHDVVKHLNIELGAFLNRPKSVSAHFFTRLRKAFCFC